MTQISCLSQMIVNITEELDQIGSFESYSMEIRDWPHPDL